MVSLLSSLKAHELLLARTAATIATQLTEHLPSREQTLVTSALRGSCTDASTSAENLSLHGMFQTDPSEIDLAREFCNLIISQRGYETILKVISARDDMLQDLMRVFSTDRA